MSCLDYPLEPFNSDDCVIDEYIESIFGQTSDLSTFDPLLWSEDDFGVNLGGDSLWPESGSNENSNISDVNQLSDAQDFITSSPSKISVSESSSLTSQEEDDVSCEVIEEFIDGEILLPGDQSGIEYNTTTEDVTRPEYLVLNQSTAARTFEIHNYSCIKYNSEETDENKSTESSPQAKQPIKGTKRRNITDFCLTEEERKLLTKEGYADFPTERKELSHQEEKILRKIRRKIRNKRSAQFSRLRKKQYVEELEKKYEECANEYRNLKKEVEDLRRQNKSLVMKMRKMLKDHTGHGQASFKTSLFVILLSFLFILMPAFRPESLDNFLTGSKQYQQQQIIRTGRHLLMTLSGHDLSSYNLNESENTINFIKSLSI